MDSNALLNTIETSICKLLMDEELTIIWANTCFYSSFGYTPEEYQKKFQNMKQYFNNYPEEFKKFSMELNRKQNKQGKFICRMPVKGNGTITVRIAATFVDEYIGDYCVLNVVITDISDMVATQKKLHDLYKEQKQNFETMVDEYADSIYVADVENYDLLFLNKVACASVHKTLDEVLGHKCYEIIQGRTSPCPFCTNEIISKDKFYEWNFYNPILDMELQLRDKKINWKGREARLEIAYDVLSPEYTMTKKEREKEALVNSIPGGSIRLDARDYTTILWYGSSFLDIIEYTKEQFEEELHSTCMYLHPDDQVRIIKVMEAVENTGKNAAMEARIITRSGKIKILTVSLSYIKGEDSWDGIPSFYSVGIDVTSEREEQERQKKALDDAYQAARIANSAKTEFLSSMSHDIRTPINAIVGMTAIAHANLDNKDKINDCLNKINTSSEHLLALINEVLDMSKIESGKTDLVLNQINIMDLVHDTVEMCKALFAEKHHEFELVIRNVQHEKVLADKERLKQIFMNLLSNAVKYTPDGGKVILKVNELSSTIHQKGWYEFVFIDNGIGISKDFLPKIFEPFTRADDPLVSNTQGTGLGMAITENLIRLMDGNIQVKSELGTGTEFAVSIPLELQTDENFDTLTDPNKQSNTAESSILKGKRILLVEDNEINREIALELLRMHGMLADAAENGRHAVELFEQSESWYYDAILMDIQMPVLDGYEATATIRSNDREYAKRVPIIALTANAFVSDISKAQSAGMNDHISKPIDINRLLSVLKLWIETKQA